MHNRTSNTVGLLRGLHRRLGVLVAFFVVLLVISGMLLNHTGQLNLVHKPIPGPVAKLLYGTQVRADVPGWLAAEHWFYWTQQGLSMDGRHVGSCRNLVRGVVSVPDWIVVLCDQELLLLDRAGQLVEKTPVEVAGAARLGKANSLLVIGSDTQVRVLDAETLDLMPFSGEADLISWSEPGNLPDQWLANVTSSTPELNLERLILDIHSGRILGQWHVLFLDLIGLFMLLLAIGGIMMWYTRKG